MNDSLYYLEEGQKVRLNLKKATGHNPKRNKWMKAHKKEIFTVAYDKWKDKPQIVSLAEDISNPKWLFTLRELIPIKNE